MDPQILSAIIAAICAIVAAIMGLFGVIIGGIISYIGLRKIELYKTIQKINQERYDALKEITYHEESFNHYVGHIRKGEKHYSARLERSRQELRELARKHYELLGPKIKKAVYEFTDSGIKILTKDYSDESYQNARKLLENAKNEVRDTIPQRQVGGESMSTLNKMIPIEVIASYMHPFKSNYRVRISWEEALLLGQGKIVGEIRNPKDWEKVPVNKSLRAIYLRDKSGDVIRWGDSNLMEPIMGGFFHENLVCEGDDLTDAKSGYILINTAGEIKIS